MNSETDVSEDDKTIVAAYLCTPDDVHSAMKYCSAYYIPKYCMRFLKPRHVLAFQRIMTIALATALSVIFLYTNLLMFMKIPPHKHRWIFLVMTVFSALAFIYLVYMPFFMGLIYRLFLRFTRLKKSAVEVTVNDDSIVWRVDGYVKGSRSWNSVVTVARTQEGFSIPYAPNGSLAWIPNRAFDSEDDMKSFSRLAEQNAPTFIDARKKQDSSWSTAEGGWR